MKWSESAWEPATPAPRSPGLHLSSLLREYERDVLGNDARPATEDGAKRQAFFDGGFIFEELAQALLRRSRHGRGLIVQREVEADGVVMTPDVVDKRRKAIVDAKMTWKSTSHIDKIRAGKLTWEKLWPGYMAQLKSYARYHGYRRGILVVFFTMGNWKRGDDWSGPVGPVEFVFEWTADEVEANWKMVLRYRDAWLKRGGPRPYKATAKTGAQADVDFTF